VELIKVRLGLLNKKFVLENVKNHPYVVENDECCAVITNALSLLGLEKIAQKEEEIPDREFVRPRIPHEILFVTGGWTDYNFINYIQVYEARANRWLEVEEIQPTYRRAFHGTAVIGFNIYMIGGCNEQGDLNSCHCFNVV
jgi:kelch-like protein 10